MNWANIGVLGIGGLLMTVPIILHFLMQPKPVEIDFPALRFLQQRQRTTRSRIRLKNFLLLLMRCLLIALVAIALAGPSVASNDFGNWMSLGGVLFSGLVVGGIALLAYFRPQKNWLLIGILAALFLGHLIYGGVATTRLMNSESVQLIGDDQDPIAALIVVDTSPRMDLQFENGTRIEKAKALGEWLIGQFPGDSQVCIAATDGSPPFFSVDVGAATRRINSLESNFSGTKLPQTLNEGLKILDDSPLERKEIYVISDLTRESWTGENASRLAKRLEATPEYSLFVVDVGVEDPTNFSLGNVRLSAAEISKGGAITIDTQLLRSGGNAEAAPATIKFQMEKIDPTRPVTRDGETLYPDQFYPEMSLVKEVDAGSSTDVRFTMNERLPIGTYHASISLDGMDGLAIDDRRYLSFRVSETRNTLVVHPNNIDPKILVSLLSPTNLVDDGSARYACDLMSQRELGSPDLDLGGYEAIFLLDPQAMPDESWLRLEDFAKRGGGLGIFLGHNANDRGLIDPAFNSEVVQRILGGQLDVLWHVTTDDLLISPQDFSHPIYRPIQGFESSVLWHRAPISKHWGIEVDAESEDYPTQVILRFSNREPAIVERTLGLGRILTMLTPITEYSYNPNRRIWNRLFASDRVPGFLLMFGVAEYLVQSDAQSLNVQVGEFVNFQNDLRENPETYQVFSPIADKTPTALNTVNGRVRFRFNDAPGHYRLKGTFDDRVQLKGFSSNLTMAATNLTRLRPEELDEFLGQDRYELATKQDEIQRQQGTMRRGQEFYPLVVIMMLVIMGVEFLMSNRFYS